MSPAAAEFRVRAVLIMCTGAALKVWPLNGAVVAYWRSGWSVQWLTIDLFRSGTVVTQYRHRTKITRWWISDLRA